MKNTFVFFTLCSALRERQCTLHEGIIVDDVDEVMVGQAERPAMKISFYSAQLHLCHVGGQEVGRLGSADIVDERGGH